MNYEDFKIGQLWKDAEGAVLRVTKVFPSFTTYPISCEVVRCDTASANKQPTNRSTLPRGYSRSYSAGGEYSVLVPVPEWDLVELLSEDGGSTVFGKAEQPPSPEVGKLLEAIAELRPVSWVYAGSGDSRLSGIGGASGAAGGAGAGASFTNGSSGSSVHSSGGGGPCDPYGDGFAEAKRLVAELLPKVLREAHQQDAAQSAATLQARVSELEAELGVIAQKAVNWLDALAKCGLLLALEAKRPLNQVPDALAAKLDELTEEATRLRKQLEWQPSDGDIEALSARIDWSSVERSYSAEIALVRAAMDLRRAQ